MTNMALAQAAGLRESDVVRYITLRGKPVEPTAPNLRRLADGLACSADYLLGRTDVLDFKPVRLAETRKALEAIIADVDPTGAALEQLGRRIAEDTQAHRPALERRTRRGRRHGESQAGTGT